MLCILSETGTALCTVGLKQKCVGGEWRCKMKVSFLLRHWGNGHCRSFINWTFLVALVFLTMVVFAGEKNPSELTITKAAIHPEWRMQPSPADGEAIKVNPPVLLWPAVRKETAAGTGLTLEERSAGMAGKISYSIRLSQDAAFPKDKTISAADFPWAMFNPHRKLETGKWYWQYAVKEPAQPLKWSKVITFEVTGLAKRTFMPPAEKIVENCPQSHPRVLIIAEKIDRFRKSVKNLPEAQVVLKRADRIVGKQLSQPDSVQVDRQNRTERQAIIIAGRKAKAIALEGLKRIKRLCMAYLITGDEKYGRQAVDYAVHMAGWDPEGPTSTNDFADGACMAGMALAYDTCYGLLNSQQKQVLRSAIKIRANRFYHHFLGRVETRVMDNHAWQHTMRWFCYAGFATLGEIPEAKDWVSYLYELWLVKFPILGGDDGGWANGDSYFGVNYETLIYVPEIFEELTGVNLFAHQWYYNTGYFLIYSLPPGSLQGGFGDGCERVTSKRMGTIGFADVLSKQFNNPYAGWYTKQCLKGTNKKLSDDEKMQWYRLKAPMKQKDLPAFKVFDRSQARLFRDIGVFYMHTDLTDIDKNLAVAFRSSPYGSFGHMHANQNTFNIFYAGLPVFCSSGYYTSFDDKHNLLVYRHSRGHNTVLVDGLGQAIGSEGYGWIPRWLHGKQISYCLGDASSAYGNTVSDFWLQRMKESGVEKTKENGFGDAGLQRFRRHIVMLRPSTIVVYDELKAKKPVEWSWLLHSPDEISVDKQSKSLRAVTEKARSRVNIYGSGPLDFSVDDKFFSPPIDWLGKTKKAGYKKQWHAAVENTNKSAGMRFLAIIQVSDIKQQASFDEPVVDKDGWYEVGNWKIRAELNAGKQAALEVCSLDGTAVLTAGKTDGVTVAGKQYNKLQPGSALLVEKTDDGIIIQETVDRLPEAAK